MQNNNELYHYGRLGMRWGQHKYQDKYGGLNQAGRVRTRELSAEHRKLSAITKLSKKGVKRLEDVEKEYSHLTGKKIGEHTPEKVGIKAPRRVEDMTNDELTSYNARKALENTYNGYQPKPQASIGKKFVSGVFTNIISPVAIDVGKQFIKNKAMKKLNLKDIPKDKK